jgi:hypothetical protein
MGFSVPKEMTWSLVRHRNRQGDTELSGTAGTLAREQLLTTTALRKLSQCQVIIAAAAMLVCDVHREATELHAHRPLTNLSLEEAA